MSIPTIAFFAPGKQPMGVVGFRARRSSSRSSSASAGYPKNRRGCQRLLMPPATHRQRERLPA